MKREIFFTSDHHFHHKRIHKLAERPWDDYEAMEAELIERWNARVAYADHVYVLGDFCLGGAKHVERVMGLLNGTKYLVRGNHDESGRGLWEWCKDIYTLKVPDERAHKGRQRIVLCHFPILVWDQRQYGAWHLHGHSHGNLLAGYDDTALRIDVGVDCQDFAPVSYEEIRQQMEQKAFFPHSGRIDHHAPKVLKVPGQMTDTGLRGE